MFQLGRGPRAGRRCEPGGIARRAQGFHGNLGDPAVFWQRKPDAGHTGISNARHGGGGCPANVSEHKTTNRITEREVTNEARGMDCRKS